MRRMDPQVLFSSEWLGVFSLRYGRITYALQFIMGQGGVSTGVEHLYRTFHTRGSEGRVRGEDRG
jgi:hypothetical protein